MSQSKTHNGPATRKRGTHHSAVTLSLTLALTLGFNTAWAGTQTRTSAFEYDANTGLLVKEIVEPGDSNLCVVTTYTYDTAGNRTGATTRNCNGSAGSHPGVNSEAAAPTNSLYQFEPRSVSTGFDANKQFPTSSTNQVGVSSFSVQ